MRRPSRLRHMASLSLWLCSLVPSVPRIKDRPLELPSMRPVSGVDRMSIRFFHTPVRMKREKTAPLGQKRKDADVMEAVFQRSYLSSGDSWRTGSCDSPAITVSQLGADWLIS